MSPLQSEYGRPGHVLVHVNDPHFVAHGLRRGDVDPEPGLAEVLEAIEGNGLQPEGIIFSENPGLNLRAAELLDLVYEQPAGLAAPGTAIPGTAR